MRGAQLFSDRFTRSSKVSLKVSNVLVSKTANMTRSKHPLNLASSTAINSAHNLATVVTLFLCIEWYVKFSVIWEQPAGSLKDTGPEATQNHVFDTLLVEQK